MKHRISKQEAIALITPVIDNEATESEKDALFAFMATNSEVRRMYNAEKSVKRLLRDKVKNTRAPKRLRMFVHNLPDYYGNVDVPNDGLRSLRP